MVAPDDLRASQDCLLHVKRRLFGIPEAELHWNWTFHTHHLKLLSLEPAVHNHSFLHTENGPSDFADEFIKLKEVVCLQTDDKAISDSYYFTELEQNMAGWFDGKHVKEVTEEKIISFNGAKNYFEQRKRILLSARTCQRDEIFTKTQLPKCGGLSTESPRCLHSFH